MKTTSKHFEIFKKECEKWIDRFGLYGWRFYYTHKDEDPNNTFAGCYWPELPQDRVFTLRLTVNISWLFTIRDIKRSAFHEVCEALLYRISYLGLARHLMVDEISEERHNLIRTLEKAVWDRE